MKLPSFIFITLFLLLYSNSAVSVNNTDTCETYPIIFPSEMFNGASIGNTYSKIKFGNAANKHSYLTWNGELDYATLKSSLTLPDHDQNYVNPINPSDYVMGSGDVIFGFYTPPIDKSIKKALRKLIGKEIIVPTYSLVENDGIKSSYTIDNFIKVLITKRGLSLSKGTIKLWFTYNGEAECDSNLPPEAYSDSINIDEDIATDITLNALSPDGFSLLHTIETQPSNGQLSLIGDVATYTPNQNYYGTDGFQFKVNDGVIDSNTAMISITIVPVEDYPVFTSTPVTSVMNTSLYQYDVDATDDDNDAITFSLSVNPTGMSIDAMTGEIVWQPEISQVGNHSVTIIATDAKLNTSNQSFNVEVTELVNSLPVFTSTPVTSVMFTNIYQYDVEATDNDNDSITFSLSMNPTGMTIDSATGEIVWQPELSHVGSHSVTVIATDAALNSSNQTFNVEVTELVNSLPVFTSIPPTSVGYQTVFDYRLNATDADGDEITYRIVQAPMGVTLERPRDVEYIFSSFDKGQHTFIVEADDGKGGITQQSFVLSVTAPVNKLPTVNKSYLLREAKANELYSYELIYEDDENDNITFTVEEGPLGLSIEAYTGIILWTPTESQVGTHTIALKLDDGHAEERESNQYTSINYTIEVESTNLPPEIISEPVRLANEEQTYSYQVVAKDLEVISYSLVSAPNGMTIDSETGQISWLPSSADVGEHFVRLKATDTLSNSTDHFYILKVLSGNIDSDNDGVYDIADFCPNTFTSEVIDSNGCSIAQLDTQSIIKTSKIPNTGANHIFINQDDAYYRSGTTRHFFRDNNAEVVYDVSSQLKWQDNSDVVTLAMNWDQADSYCNNLVLDEETNWRLPSIFQLWYLVDWSSDIPSASSKMDSVFSNTQAETYKRYWSNDKEEWQITGGGEAYTADAVDFVRRTVSESRPQYELDQMHYVRCVSGSRNYIPKLGVIDNGYIRAPSGTYYDTNNELLWENLSKYDNDRELTWAEANDLCQNMTVYDVGGWRLPTAYELHSIVKHDYIYSYKFWYVGWHYWSSTTTSASEAVTVGLNSSHMITVDNRTISEQRQAICVRDFSMLSVGMNIEPISVTIGDTVTIDDLNIVAGELPIIGYEWYLGGYDRILLSTEPTLSIDTLPIGVHTIELRIDFGQEGSNYNGEYVKELVVVVTDEIGNQPPVAVAGLDQKVRKNSTFTLDGSASYDDNQIVSYEWWLSGRLKGTEAVYQSTMSNSLNLTARLVVKDANGLSHSDEVKIYSEPENAEITQCFVNTSLPEPLLHRNPSINSMWQGMGFSNVSEIERGFNAARLTDESINTYLFMPEQNIWDSWSVSEKVLYLINSEREARGIKAFEGVSPIISSISQTHADYLLSNSIMPTHYREDNGKGPEIRLDDDAYILSHRGSHVVAEAIRVWDIDNISIYTIDEHEKVVEAIFDMIYSSPGLNRHELLQTGLVEDSGQNPNKEGLLGIGFAKGNYDPQNYQQWGYNPTNFILVINVIDPLVSWDQSNIMTIDTDSAHGCTNEVFLYVSPDAPKDNLESISLSPVELTIDHPAEQTLTAIARYNDSSTQDISQYIQYLPYSESLLDVNSGQASALGDGTVKAALRVNDVESNFANITLNRSGLTDQEGPQASAGSNAVIRVGSSITLDASSSSDDVGIVSYFWYFDGQFIADMQSISQTLITEGTYSYMVKVVDTDFNYSFDEVKINVLPQLPLAQCQAELLSDDNDFNDIYPENDIAYVGNNFSDVNEIEKAFNHARSIDNTIFKYLVMPTQIEWNAMTVQEQGLFILNSEREARSIKPFDGVSNEVVDVARQYADYLRVNNEVITHYRSNDNASPDDRLDENITILENRDNPILSESIYSFGTLQTPSEAVISALYYWTYHDKNPLSGASWGHRSHIIQTGLNENNSNTTHEGLLGFGVSIGDYAPPMGGFSGQGVVVVINTFDPSNTWDHTDTINVDTSTAHSCNDELTIPIDNQIAPVTNLKMLIISPNDYTLALYDTLAMKVTGLYDDGSSQDLTSFVSFVPDGKSIVQIDNGLVMALHTGMVKVSASVNGILSNSITLNVLSTQVQSPDISNLQDTFAESYLEYIPVNATIKSYDPKAFSIFTGVVTDRDGLPLSEVDISFHHQPEYGSVKTDIDGRFILAGQAGDRTLVYSKEAYLTVHRSTISASTTWSLLDNVMLLNIDAKKTAIDLTSNEVQVHRSTIIIDGYGERSTTLVFDGVSSATVSSPDGSSRSLNNFFLHATEYELPNSMPADLPKESAFTYCAELQIPGVADEESVNFNSSVIMYVDNFLNFEVGEIVPIGYYDRFDGQWKSSENGVVVKLLDANSDGLIDGIDYTGDSIADDINGSGNTTDDAVGLESYQVGATYWRGSLTHFTPTDFNWSSNTDGQNPADPDAKSDKEDPEDKEKECVSSYIKPKALTLHEDIAITGTGLTLHYSSQRTHGYHHKITANVSDADLPAGVIEMIAVLEIGGNHFEQTFIPTTYQDVEFIWDGTSPTGELIEGVVRGRISIGYKYQADYYSAGNVATSGQSLDSFANAWAQWGATPTAVTAREDIVRWSNNVVTLLNAPKSEIANGWSISNHHQSTPFDLIYRGDGEAEQVNNTTNILKTGISQSQYIGDDGFYQKGGLDVEYSVDEQGILLDKVTGLKWQYQVSNHIEFVQKSDAIAYCETLQLGDNGEIWRLPTSKEIGYSIYKGGDQHEFPIYRLVAKQFWTNVRANPNAKSFPALCVSGEPLDEQYALGLQRNDVDKVVIDQSNGLMWQDNNAAAGATYLWSEAVDYCEDLSHANYDDWRLPNVNELLYTLPNAVFVNQTILNFPEGTPWTHDAAFRQPYWTSTPNIANPEQQAWAVESLSYSYHAYDQTSESYNVRCVRDDLTRSRSPYVFDHRGRHIKTLDMNSGITLTTFNYDTEGRLITIKDQFNNTITINRDVNGKATEVVSPDGYTTKLTVDDFNNLTHAEYDDATAYDFVYQNSLMVEETDVRNNVFSRSFDSTGRITQSVDPEGGQWDFFSNKDEFSGVLSYGFTTAEGNTYQSLFSFLENGDKETITTFKDLSQLVSTQQGDDLKTSYQSSGVLTVIDNVVDVKTKQEIPHIITTTLPSGLASIVQLDKTYAENGTDTSKTTITVTNNPGVNERVSTLFTDTVAGTGLSTSAQNRTSSTIYDPLTQQVTSQQITGLTASDYQYDNRGRLTTTTSGDRVTTYTYNDVASKGGLTSVTNAMNQTTDFDYDLMGRLTQTTYYDGSVLTKNYDNNGNLASITPPNQPTHYFNYNSVDKEIDYTPPVVTGVADPSTVYDYDLDRKLTSIIRPDSQLLNFNYTANTDQLASMEIPRGTYSYTYDAYANITKITAPDTDELSFTYDGNLPLSQTWVGTVAGSVSQTYSTDFMMNQQCVSTSTSGTNCIDYSYDLDNLITIAGNLTISRESQKAGLIKGSILDNITMVRTNDSFGEMSDEATKFNTTTLLAADYLRDKLGRITERTLNIQGASSTDYYGYNDMGRLVSVTNGSIITSYVFDDNGNRLSKTIDDGTTPIVTNGAYDAQDRLTSYGHCTYQYTANGELSQKTCGTDITSYVYDVLGNLMQVTLPDNTKIDYLIDGLNRRIGKKVNDTLEQGFLYGDQLNPVAELDSSNNIVSQFIYGTKVNVPDYMIKGGVTYKIITDQLGSPRLVVNADTGVVAQQIDYDEFGIITQDTNSNFQPFGFAGGLVDNQTGLTRFGARDYDAQTGRWTSKDPIRFAGGDSNIYGYVFSDPVNFIDPNGEAVVIITVAVITIASGGTWAYIAGKKTKHDTKVYHDAIIKGDPQAIKRAHQELQKDALLYKGIGELAGMGLTLGKGIPGSTNETYVDAASRIFHANKDKISNELHLFSHYFDDEDSKVKQCH